MKSGEDWLPWEELVKQEEESVCVMVRSGEWGGMASMGGSGETRRRRECVCGPLFAPSPMLGLLMST